MYSIDIYQGHSVFLGVRMIALYGLDFDSPLLDEFKGKNEIVSLQSSFHICLCQHSVFISYNIYILVWQFVTAYHLLLGRGFAISSDGYFWF